MIFNKWIDLFFIRFPIIFPLIYLSLIFVLPEIEKQITLLTLLLLAEPHFGSTWMLFIDQRMRKYALEKKKEFIWTSLVILLLAFSLFFVNTNIFYVLFVAFNVWHVTKQSIGITNLYTIETIEKRFQSKVILITNAFIVLFGLYLHLMLGLISPSKSFYLGLISLCIIFIIFIYQKTRFNSIQNSLTTLTGMSIFLPSFFVDKPINAIVAGVTMHYSQYILLTLKVYLSKRYELLDKNLKYINNFSLKRYFIILIIYSIIATVFTFVGSHNGLFIYNIFLLLPVSAQILHFYLDSLIWRFSDSKIKSFNIKYLFL